MMIDKAGRTPEGPGPARGDSASGALPRITGTSVGCPPTNDTVLGRPYSAIWPTRGWVPAPSHVPLTALLITNGDAGLCIRMRWRSSLTSADSADDRVQSGLIFVHRAG